MGHLITPTNFRYSKTLFWKNEWVSVSKTSHLKFFYEDNLINNIIIWFFKNELNSYNYIIDKVRLLRSFKTIIIIITFYNANFERNFKLNFFKFNLKKKYIYSLLKKNKIEYFFIKNFNNLKKEYMFIFFNKLKFLIKKYLTKQGNYLNKQFLKDWIKRKIYINILFNYLYLILKKK